VSDDDRDENLGGWFIAALLSVPLAGALIAWALS